MHGANLKENTIKFKGKKLEIKEVVTTLKEILGLVLKAYIYNYPNLTIPELIDKIDLVILQGPFKD